MKTLILCVDRDDDLGRKAGVRGPVVGRENNVNAAVSLALADPEDSDANAIFAAVSLYDRLKKEGKDVEIATLTGSENVGMKSDEIIAKQIDKVVNETGPDDIIFVSDGSEDEFILPIITTRRPIKHIRRVIVRQSKNIESTYYIIVKALKDKKLMKKILMPVALLFLAYAIASIIIILIKIGNPSWNLIDPGTFALTVISLTLGLYFLEKTYSVGHKIRNLEKALRTAMVEAKVAFIGDLIAGLLILAGLDFAYNDSLTSGDIIIQILLFLHTFVLWFVFAVLVREGGRIFDIWIHKGEYTKSFWIGFLTTLSSGIIIYAVLDYILLLTKALSVSSIVPILIMIGSGLIISILAAFLHRRLRGVESVGNREVDENLPQN